MSTPYQDALLDVEAVAVCVWLDRLAGWEEADATVITDPILRRMAEIARDAPVAIEELRWRLTREGHDHLEVGDRITRIEWARHDHEAQERAYERLRRASPSAGVDPWQVVYSDTPPPPEALAEPIIDGLLRRGETMNVIAPPKIGKTWLVHGLALSLASGWPWLGHLTTESRVLIMDNELHEATLRYRLGTAMAAAGLDPKNNLQAISLRGALMNLYAVCDWLSSFPARRWDVVVCDAFYRMVPEGKSENDNAEMAALYNHMDRVAHRLGIAWVLIHHSSKGNQAGKTVTDVGSGAGSMSRAADCHLVLRRHRDEGCVVMEAAARSFPPPPAIGLRWSFPSWVRDDDLDTEALDDGMPPSSADRWPLERVLSEFVTPAGIRLADLKQRLQDAGCSQRHARDTIKAIEAMRGMVVTDFNGDRVLTKGVS